MTCGNIGARNRLEFTVIGDVVNVAARLGTMCKEPDQPVFLSDSFARCFPGRLPTPGRHRLRGAGEPQEIYHP